MCTHACTCVHAHAHTYAHAPSSLLSIVINMPTRNLERKVLLSGHKPICEGSQSGNLAGNSVASGPQDPFLTFVAWDLQ